jgi:nucleoside-diphosphate-sugar epimerase
MRIDNNSRILITGGAGFIGSSFCDYLLEKGISPKNIDVLENFTTGIHENADVRLWDNYKNSVLALTKKTNYYTHIYNFAARARVQPSYNEPETYMENVRFLTNLLGYVRTVCPNSYVYHMSSSTVITDLTSPYAYSKKMCEDLCRMYINNYNLNITVFRLSSVYGKKMDLSKDNSLLLGRIVRSYITGEDFHLNNNGESIRHYTDVDSLCEFLFNYTPKPFEGYFHNVKNHFNTAKPIHFLKKIKLKSIFNKDNVKETNNNYNAGYEYIELSTEKHVVTWLENELTTNLDYWKNRLKLWDGLKL